MDLTKLILHSDYPAFINNRVYEGTFTLSGSISEGINTINHSVPLATEPDLVDVMFEGPASGISRPDGAWFKEGFVDVPSSYGFDMTAWITSRISGTNLVITATIPQQ